jgi:glutamate/tyrosine decarboxylase-like PLP-dependent enzyme
MDPGALAEQISADRRQGFAPFLVVGTAGTTNAGVIDPLRALAEGAAREGLWYHVDAAWGGAAALSARLRGLLDGIAQADSITFDAHKWLSAPMGAGIYLTRDPGILARTFSTPTAYMPRDASDLDVTDPHLHSIQWSRRFIGLKVFLSLLVAGWDGYAAAIDRMTAIGERLREGLAADGWEIVNCTPLPVICFADPRLPDPEPIVQSIVRSGEAWISTTKLKGRPVARACITNYRTSEQDVDALVAAVGRVRRTILGG